MHTLVTIAINESLNAAEVAMNSLASAAGPAQAACIMIASTTRCVLYKAPSVCASSRPAPQQLRTSQQLVCTPKTPTTRRYRAAVLSVLIPCSSTTCITARHTAALPNQVAWTDEAWQQLQHTPGLCTMEATLQARWERVALVYE